MKRVLMVLFVLALLPGCSYIPTQSNQSPRAYIDDITPSQVNEGEVVRFTGHGTDADGRVVTYRWRSDKDGQLGVTAEFETSSLSVGTHAIYLMVQDNSDAWSAEARSAVTVLPAVAAPVAINSFTASPLSISAGDSVTLSWNVSNATTVSIDRGVGTVSRIGSAQVAPSETTTYTLTATGSSATVNASVTVTVQQSVRRVTLTADSEVSGFVRWSGIYTMGGVYVGDDSSDRGIQGFLTFDISRIPDDAVVTRVSLDFSGYEIPHDMPFPEMGCLSAYVHSYITLYGQYWTKDVTLPIAEWCGVDDLHSPIESTRVRNALQQRVGQNRFQFRLQFAERMSDGDGMNDLLYWPERSLPRMTVEYREP